MQIPTDLKEILLDCFNHGSLYVLYGGEKTFLDWLEENESKILALGKPEPLAKNKQGENKCPQCNGSGKDGFDRCIPPNQYICDKCNGRGYL